MAQDAPVDAAYVDNLVAQYQKRWEGTYHWRSMCSMLLGNPGLRAAWPMSVVDYQAPECTDISGHGYDLRANGGLGTVDFGVDPNAGIAPVAYCAGGAGQWLERLDGGAGNWADITGNELYILAADRGLTIGGWVWWATSPWANVFIAAKDDIGANRQWHLRAALNTAIFTVWAGAVAVTSTNATLDGWNHVVGVFNRQNQDLHIVLNGQVTTNAGAAPAGLVDTGASVALGASSGGAQLLTGYLSDWFMCACALPVNFVRAGYEYTKAAYGVK